MNDINLTVKQVKSILDDAPDDMEVVIPIIDSEDSNKIYGFRFVRTAGILEDSGEKKPVLCLNTAEDSDIGYQIEHLNDPTLTCKTLLF